MYRILPRDDDQTFDRSLDVVQCDRLAKCIDCADPSNWQARSVQVNGENTVDPAYRVSDEYLEEIPEIKLLPKDYLDGYSLKHMSLLKYREGGHFVRHTDFKCDPLHVATYLLFPPGNGFVGGDLLVWKDGKKSTYRTSEFKSWQEIVINLGTEHQVTPVKSGVRFVFKGELHNTNNLLKNNLSALLEPKKQNNVIPHATDKFQKNKNKIEDGAYALYQKFLEKEKASALEQKNNVVDGMNTVRLKSLERNNKADKTAKVMNKADSSRLEFHETDGLQNNQKRAQAVVYDSGMPQQFLRNKKI
jgi:hypothetical protein